MYLKFRLSMACFIIIGLVLLLLVSGCDPFYQVITFDNQTSFPIQVDIKSVPLDYQDIPEFNYTPGDFITTGESKKYVTSVQDDRTIGSERKYPVAAVTETGEVIFYRVFTWDELHDMDWTVVIGETQ